MISSSGEASISTQAFSNCKAEEEKGKSIGRAQVAGLRCKQPRVGKRFFQFFGQPARHLGRAFQGAVGC